MYVGSLVFAQLISLLPLHAFHRCVQRYKDIATSTFFLSRSISRHGFRTADFSRKLAYIEACLRAISGKLYHMGIRSPVARSTLAYANEARD